MEYLIRKEIGKERVLHVYFFNNNGTYENGTVDWMCSVYPDKEDEEDVLDWNDHFVPTMVDMRYVILIYNLFDVIWTAVQLDTFHFE